jgi:hypothetical protein
MRLFSLQTSVGGHDIETIHFPVTTAPGSASDKPHPPDGADRAQSQPAKTGHGVIVPDGEAVRLGQQLKVRNQIVGGETQSLNIFREFGHQRTVPAPAQCLSAKGGCRERWLSRARSRSFAQQDQKLLG